MFGSSCFGLERQASLVFRSTNSLSLSLFGADPASHSKTENVEERARSYGPLRILACWSVGGVPESTVDGAASQRQKCIAHSSRGWKSEIVVRHGRVPGLSQQPNCRRGGWERRGASFLVTLL